jgi:hypothetical protein
VQTTLSLFGGTIQEHLAAQQEDATAANAQLAADVNQLFVQRIGRLMCNIENSMDHFLLKDDFVQHVNDFYTSH